MADTDITAALLRELVHYERATGAFTWMPRGPHLFENDTRRCNVWNGRYAGKRAGSVTNNGYEVISVCDQRTLSHRLAFFYVTGGWPPADMDHIDGDRLNNRWANLRSCDRTTNAQNQRRPPKSKGSDLPLGVYRRSNLKHKCYSASIRVDGKGLNLGYFHTAEEAHAAYLEAKRIHHQGCTI